MNEGRKEPVGLSLVARGTGSRADPLEPDAPGALVRSVRNSSAPINRLPPEVLSLVPDYHGGPHADRDLIALTHVCRYWRDTFTSRPSLWTQLTFTDIDKTNTYIERSKTSPLELCLSGGTVINDPFDLVTQNVSRLKSLTTQGKWEEIFHRIFLCDTLLLEKLDVYSTNPDHVLDGALLKRDLSSVRELRLCGIIAHVPWNNLENLQVITLKICSPKYTVTQLLDLFESAPRLCTVELVSSIKSPSNAPPERIVPLHHLKALTIHTAQPSILLGHLRIPVGVSLVLKLLLHGGEPPSLDYLLEGSPNFNNLSDITSVNLSCGIELKHIQLSGPNGSLHMTVVWKGVDFPWFTQDCQFLHWALSHRISSAIQRLVVSTYTHLRPAKVEECPIFQMLSPMSNLRTLTLIDGEILPFILALDPEQNPSNFMLCPNMETLDLCAYFWPMLGFGRLITMAKNRASRGAKLLSVMFTNRGDCVRRETLELREHVEHVDYRVGSPRPAWDGVPRGSVSGGRGWVWKRD